MVYLEKCETFHKQTFRNRCRFLSSNGVENLSFPIVHNGRYSIGEVLVDYSTPWVEKTKRAIDSAYYTSAYFEYYRDELYALLDRREETLWELDLSIIDFFCRKIGISVQFAPTEAFYKEDSPYGEDYREAIHPKREDRILSSLGLDRPYFQVFSGKFPFQENLSIMDLLFNEGPNSITFLKRL